jgi:hypothetical protein
MFLGTGPLPPVVDNCADIEKLDPQSQRVVRARFLPDDGIPCLARLGRLKNIDFGSGSALAEAAVTDEGLHKLAELHLPELSELVLSECHRISDRGFALVATMPTLTELQAMNCTGLTDRGLGYICGMRQLTYLDIRRCPGITDAGFEKLAGLQNLRTLEIGGLENVSTEAVDRLRRALPHCLIYNEYDWAEGPPIGPYHNRHERELEHKKS